MIQSIQESLKRKVAHSEEVVSKELHTEEKSIEVLYINTISDEKIFQEYVVVPFLKLHLLSGS
ncbi:hypothetical protein [Heyndrickxia sporothermodurans]|uniref:Uncharacterized protein n=1 Tax=Heyndrickxia sporothermodurans TaxID=46224 RepID=A0AB37HHN2_9BACI|nr:hypothetical protein JGZ69_10345 [Heyndrickxia sporothermodurans]